MTTPFGYLSVASPLHDEAAVSRVLAPTLAVLHEVGGVPRNNAEDEPRSPLVIVVGTGGTEAAILDHVRRRRLAAPFEPVLLATHRSHNSLPAALEAMARVRLDGGRGLIVQVDAADPAQLRTAVVDVAAIHRMHAARLGLVGMPSEWLVASVPQAKLVRQRWGVELVPIDNALPIAAHPHVDPGAAREVAVHFAGTAEPSADLLSAAALHPALLDVIEGAHVDAVTVRCFDYLGELGTSGCVALAQLNDAGVVAGCEGDVASAVAMLLVRSLLDLPSWMANPAYVDVDGNRVLLAHCTVAPSLVEDVELHTHFESGVGVGLRGRFARQWVTLLRLGGSALERFFVAEGEIEQAGESDDLCRTQVTVRLEGVRAGSLLEDPLGNHLLLVPGRHRERLERWWHLAFG